MTIYHSSIRQKEYIYLVNLETLDVKRVSRYNNLEYDSEIKTLITDKYVRTRPEIYRRFKLDLLSSNSFIKVERPKGSGKLITTNIYN